MLQAFRCENTFKLRDIENKIKSKAPYLLELFQQLASRQRNLMYDTAAKRRGNTDDWVDEEILDDATMDVDEGNMEFSDAYGDTSRLIKRGRSDCVNYIGDKSVGNRKLLSNSILVAVQNHH